MMGLELRVLAALGAVLLLPGAALVALAPLGDGWSRLSRLALAVALSIAFFPVLFTLTPWLRWGPLPLAALLAAAAGVLLWQLWRSPPSLVRPDALGWATGLLLLLILATRWWMAYHYPYPAWTDSLHHTLLTQLTLEQGRLPTSLEPYFPVPLTMYHLGLYSLAAPVGWLAQAPPHTALLWTAQTLNGLGALGVYLVLARRATRLAALVGMAAMGLWSFQPAFYVNWGRFTQIASQTILPVAWLLTCQAAACWASGTGERRKLWAVTAGAALLSAGLFLLHFRVAVFFLLWVLVGLGELALAERAAHRLDRQWLGRMAAGLAWTAALALLLLSPALGPAVGEYVGSRIHQSATPINPVESAAVRQAYFRFPRDSIITLGLHRWLLLLTGAAALLGCLRRNGLVIGCLVWAGLLMALGHTYLLRISLLNVTNLGAILIMLYLPASVILGAAAAEAVALLPSRWRYRAELGIAGGVLASALFFVPQRVRDVEPRRYFVTDQDLAAMSWIRTHTPPDARFAVNTTFWLPKMPHGSDAGYWLPYLAGREITAGVMLLNLAEEEYQNEIVARSQAALALAQSEPAVAAEAIAALRALGVEYLYAGALGNPGGVAFDPERLANTPGIELLYRDGPVVVAHLLPTENGP
jgi:hypothetical protein